MPTLACTTLPMTAILDFCSAAWHITLELAPWLLLGAAVAGLLHGLVPPSVIQKRFRGLRGVVGAVALGIPLPLCSCGVIPAGIGLKKSGASDGAAIGFLIATPQTGVDSVAVSAGFLGWPFALFKVAAALLMGLLGGGIVEQLSTSDNAEVTPSTTTHRRDVRAMASHAVDVVRMIWRWLLFGVLLSAALTLYLPTGTLNQTAGTGIVASLLMLGAALPLYVCATASVPIAAALVAGGLPTGSALVFLMAGPATNVATVGAIWRAFGTRTLVTYLSVVVGGSLLLALAYEPLLGGLTPLSVGAEAHTGVVPTLAAVALCALCVRFALDDLTDWLRRRRSTSQAHTQQRQWHVEGMTCGGCASRLERTLSSIPGVDHAAVSFDQACATIVGPVSDPEVQAAMTAAGFQSTRVLSEAAVSK